MPSLRKKAGKRIECPAWFTFAAVSAAALATACQMEAERKARQNLELLEKLGPPRLPRVTVAPRPISPVVTEWGVTTRPAKITHDFCFRFATQTTPEEQKRLVPSSSSRSQYIRVGKLIPECWGRWLDERKTSFDKLRWIAAPNDILERQDRNQRVLDGEHPQELLKRPAKSRRRGTPGTEAQGAAGAVRPPLSEEELQRLEALLKAMGQEIRLPRDAQDEPRETGAATTAEATATKRKRRPRAQKAPVRKPGRMRPGK